VLGVIHLFVLSFKTGDIYPAYSSLRSDPLGTRALYESLKNFDIVSVNRNYHSLRSLKFEPETTFFYFGVSADDYKWVKEGFINVLDRLTSSGGRLVLSFLPENRRGPKPKNDIPKEKLISIETHWGISFEFAENLGTKEENRLDLLAISTRSDFPSGISWHTNLYFKLLDNRWQVLYLCDGHPVIVERSYGRGTILLCADSFFVSNEALWSERHPQLLTRLVGQNSNIVFDEAHFGITKSPGVVGLIRHYRFHWFLATLAAIAFLFVWKNAGFFVPPYKDADSSSNDVVSEKDYTQGLVALLRRNIPRSGILQVSVQEWEQTYKKDQRVRPVTFDRIKGVIHTQTNSHKKQTDPVEGYARISRIIKEGRGHE
jgi:hypothetical protein